MNTKECILLGMIAEHQWHIFDHCKDLTELRFMFLTHWQDKVLVRRVIYEDLRDPGPFRDMDDMELVTLQRWRGKVDNDIVDMWLGYSPVCKTLVVVVGPEQE